MGATYRHEGLLAPTQEILDDYKKRKGAWSLYEERFMAWMADRLIEHQLARSDFEIPTALLCSEATPEHCHRRLVCDYLGRHWPNATATHL